ncbi:MAG TPA: hypothetical protein VGN49_11315 [Micrococcaceae bacterium]|jgi:hypothetical protein|nr:hypothetical protein [Micrococcaceae bacterium]
MAKTPAQRAAKHGDKAAVPTQRASAVVNPYAPRDPAKTSGNPNLLVIAGAVASAFLFWYFHLLTLNQMTQLSGGRAMPDSMLGGFSQAYVGQLRAAMSPDALGQLQFVHKTAGTLFPLVFAFSAMVLIALNVSSKRLRRALWVPPLLFAIIQIWSNFAVDGMLSARTLDGGQVALASVLVVASWVLLVVSLLGTVYALYLGRRRKKADAPTP